MTSEDTNSDLISIDYETFLIGNENIFPKPVCLSYYDGKDTGLFNKKETEQFLVDQLQEQKLIVAHNAVFECGVTLTHYPDLTDLIFEALDKGLFYCTRINEALWNTQKEKPLNKLSLADLVLHYFDTDISATKGADAWRLRYSELDGIPFSDWPQEAIDYAIDDSKWAFAVREKQTSINQTLALKSAVYLNMMGAQGFSINQNRVKLLEQEILEYLNPRYDFLVSEGFCDYVGKKPRKQMKKLKQYIIDSGVELQYTIKGGVSTSGESLASYMNQKADPIIEVFSELTQYEKIYTAYISHLRDAPKIYSQYSTVMNTGRTSSSGSKFFDSVNIQNQPREVKNVTYDIRNCYQARPGFKIVSIDYSGLELCSAAHQLYKTLGYSHMRDALNEGNKPTDMHSKLAAKIKGISYEEFLAKKSEYKDDRQKAKPINLGFPGGIGYDTMRHQMWKDGIKTKYQILEKARRKTDLYYYQTNLCLPDLRIKRLNKKEYALVQDELVLLKQYMFRLYPDLEQFLKSTHEKFMTGQFKWKKNEFDEWEEEPMYRYETNGFVRDWCTYTALCNGFLMQSPSAIGAQNMMCHLNRQYYKHPEVIPQAFIHDETVLEIKEDNIEQHVKDVSEIMIDGMHSVLDSVRITVEAEVCGDHWQKAGGEWSKVYWKDNPGEKLNEV